MTPTEISVLLEYGTNHSVTRRHEPENRDNNCTDIKTKNSHDRDHFVFVPFLWPPDKCRDIPETRSPPLPSTCCLLHCSL